MPDEIEPSQAELLRVGARYEGAEAIVTVAGELDYSIAERFVACILEALGTKARSVTVGRPLRSRSRGLLWPGGLTSSSRSGLR